MIDGSQQIGVAALFLIGLMGAGHCAGMCGGIVTGLGLSSTGKYSRLFVIAYNFGRITSYATAGAMVAMLGYWGSSTLALGPWFRIFAGLLLVFMGLYLANWWNGIVHLEKLGAIVWRIIQPLGKQFLPPKTLTQALCLGLVWGWLPCGLVYSALAYSATAASPLQGAVLMAAFGLGTAPAMLVGGFFSERAQHGLQNKIFRQLMAVFMIVFGVWTMSFNAQMLRHSNHSHVSQSG